MEHPLLPDTVRVLPGTDVEPLWGRFHVFEALHHGMDIMNPLSSDHLDEVLAALEVDDGDRVLDIACGHGELLLRLARRHAIEGRGVDLSPWQVARAAQRASDGRLRGALDWWLGPAEEMPVAGSWDVVTCLGASWIWDGFEGTARALVARCRPGGRIALGDVQRSPGAGPGDVPADYAGVLSRDEQRRALARVGVDPVLEVAPGPNGWLDYDRRTATSAAAYHRSHPGEESEGFVAEQARWVEEHRVAMLSVTWTVWVGRVVGG